MKQLKLMKTLLVAVCLLAGANAWASTQYVGSMYTYDVVFGTPNAETPTDINVQTDFTTDNSTQSQTMLTLSIDGSVLAGNQGGGRTYSFTTAPTSGIVRFKATGKFIGGNYDFFHIQGTKKVGEETSSLNIVSSPYALPSGSGSTTVLRIFGEDITASYVYTPRDVLYGFDVTIDLDHQKISYSITYASKGSSGTVSQLSTLEGNVNVPDGFTLTSVTGLNMPRGGQKADNYYDNVAFYSAVSNETLYTATFTETNSLDPTVKIYSDAGRSEEVSNGELRDQTTYYYRATLHGYEDYEGSFTVNGANPSVNFTMTALEKVSSLSVYARISENNYLIKTIDLDDKYVGDQVSFTYPRFYKIDNTLYIVSDAHYNKHGGYFKWNNYTLEGSSVVLDYDGGTIENVVYYSEGENITGMTADGKNNGDIRCSDGQGGRSSSVCTLLPLGTGVYKLTSRVWGNDGTIFTYRAAGSAILEQSTVGYLEDKTVCFNVISGTAAITVQGSESATGKVIDYVYIQKLGDATVSVYNGDFENSTWGDGWNGTGSDKANEFAKQTSSQTWGATGNFAEMWTGGSFSTEANLNQILINVPAGNYILSADILNNVSSSGGVLYAKVGNASDVTTAAENASGANESVSFTVASTSNVVVGFKTTAINTKSGWIAVDNFKLQQVVSKNITSAGWATYYSPYALDFSSSIENLTKAYIVTGATGSTLDLTEITGTIPAETGILLEGEGDVVIPVVASSSTDVSENKLEGVISETAGVDAGIYVLMNINSKVGFYKTTNAFTVGANTAYLPADFAGARAFYLFDEDATGINAVSTTKAETGDYYNLAGQRVAQPTKGLYIVNGKKYVVK